jgi:UDP-N-acetylmuramyl pentapeptide phosphotransferase/UDP-N-acetylglucosamine-1-phosphate transferase
VWPAWIAAPAALLLVGLALLCNHRWFGFLPDDPPGPGRKQHARPTPLGGVLLLPLLVAPLYTDPLAPVGAAIFVAMLCGFRDDRGKERGRDLDWRAKGAALLIAATFTASAASQGHGSWPWLAFCVLLAFVLINASNFLDNMDGVCAALSATSILLLTHGEGPLAWAGFAALGFLPWNWPHPRVFLGDAGAYGLGVCTAAAVLLRLHAPPETGGAWWPALLPVSIQLLDFIQVVTARLWLALPPWIGDRRHLTHILHTQLHLPKVLIAPLLAGLTLLLGWLADL